MAGLTAYSGITTKVKAMGVHLLTEGDYEKIIHFDGVSEIVSYLKQKPTYGKIFDGLDEQRVHRDQIEHVVGNALYDDFIKIYQFCSGKQRDILSLYLLHFEIKLLKDCILSTLHQENEQRKFLYANFLEKHSKLPLDRLAGASSMDELVACLEGTRYYGVVAAFHEDQGEALLFDYQTQLDVFYYKEVWRLKDAVLKGKERVVFTEQVGREIDMLNILWIYRYKMFYSADVAQIYRSILPIRYKLTKEQIRGMVESANMEEFIKLLQQSGYKKYVGDDEKVDMEVAYHKLVRDVYHGNAKRYPHSIAPVHEYLYLREREVDKLMTALECVRYQLSPEDSLAILKDY